MADQVLIFVLGGKFVGFVFLGGGGGGGMDSTEMTIEMLLFCYCFAFKSQGKFIRFGGGGGASVLPLFPLYRSCSADFFNSIYPGVPAPAFCKSREHNPLPLKAAGEGSGTPMHGFVLIARAADKINEIHGSHPQMPTLRGQLPGLLFFANIFP